MPPVTIQEVARHAGVSAATVSNFFNWPDRLSTRMADRVRSAVDELGFVPNMPARQLRTSRSGMVGLSVINASNPFFGEIVVAVEQAAVEKNLSVMVGSTHESPQQQRQYLRMFEQFRFDGIILTPFDDNLQQAHEIAARGTPVVLVDRTDDEGLLPSVGTDHEAGGYLVAQHLIEQGCRRLCFVSGPRQVQQMVRRLRGYQKAVDEAGNVSLEVLEFPDLDVELGREAGRQIADRDPQDRPDGVFGGNDLQAIGIVAELVDAGVDVPGEVAVIGYDDIVFAATTARPLTSIRQPSREIGAAAAEMLFERLLSPSTPAHQQLFEPELQVRASTRR